jgi:hypothetical protein
MNFAAAAWDIADSATGGANEIEFDYDEQGCTGYWLKSFQIVSEAPKGAELNPKGMAAPRPKPKPIAIDTTPPAPPPAPPPPPPPPPPPTCSCGDGTEITGRSIPASETSCGYQMCSVDHTFTECTSQGWKSTGNPCSWDKPAAANASCDCNYPQCACDAYGTCRLAPGAMWKVTVIGAMVNLTDYANDTSSGGPPQSFFRFQLRSNDGHWYGSSNIVFPSDPDYSNVVPIAITENQSPGVHLTTEELTGGSGMGITVDSSGTWTTYIGGEGMKVGSWINDGIYMPTNDYIIQKLKLKIRPAN